MSTCQTVVDDLVAERTEEGEEFSGDTVEVEVSINAIVKLTHTDTVTVPVEIADNAEDMAEYLDQCYSDVDSDEFEDLEDDWNCGEHIYSTVVNT